MPSNEKVVAIDPNFEYGFTPAMIPSGKAMSNPTNVAPKVSKIVASNRR
jgi:hypothetical protein